MLYGIKSVLVFCALFRTKLFLRTAIIKAAITFLLYSNTILTLILHLTIVK